ncbi:MAG: zinc-ribbon domain-containing protein [Treponema sp.]|nr:zinc-ribbon domain-containing protein [Candidatus Treponema scatequi]
MFCSNCGKEILEGAKFCPSCGTPINQIEVSKTKEISNSNEITQDLERCYDHFSKIADIYDFYQKGKSLINNTVWVKKVSNEYGVAMFFLIAGIIGLIPTLSSVFKDPIMIVVLWIVLLIEIVSIISGGICAGIYGKHKSTIELYEEKLPIMENKIIEHYAKYENCPLAIDYTNPVVISSMITYIKSGRASSIKEAINIYEDECHKVQMISEMKQMKAFAEQASAAATLTAINTL